MDLSTIGVGIFGKALDYADTAVQYYNQKKLNRQAQKDTQQNMQLEKELNLKQQYDSIAQYTSALRAAGLNPALASGGVQQAQGVSMASGNAGTAAKPDNSFAATLEAVNALEKQESEIENLKSQTQLNKAAASKATAEAESTNLKVKHSKSFDTAIDSAFTSMLSEMKDSTENPYMKGFLEEFLSNNSEVDLGTLEAFNASWFELSQKERDRELDFIAKEMDKKVLSMQYSNGAAEALADMPKAQRLQIYRNMALMDAQIASLNADRSLTEDRRKAIRASVEKLGQETLSILHHDPAAMWNAGEISSLGVMLGYDGIKAAMAAGGFAVGTTTVGRVAPAAKGAVTLSRAGSQTLKAAKPKGMSPENYSKVVARAKELAKGDKVKEAQLIDKAVRHWHQNYGD